MASNVSTNWQLGAGLHQDSRRLDLQGQASANQMGDKDSAFNTPKREANYATHQQQSPSKAFQSGQHKSYVSALSRRTSGSHYVSGINSVDLSASAFYEDDGVSEIGDRESFPFPNNPGIIRQASLGKKVKANVTLTRMPSSKSHAHEQEYQTRSAEDRAAMMEALTAAVQQGLNASSHNLDRPPIARIQTDQSTVRMPFATNTASLATSPTSIYTDLGRTYRKRDSVPTSNYIERDSKPLAVVEHEINYNEFPRMNDLPTPLSMKSSMSSKQLLGFGIEQKGMSGKFAAGKRPPPLDIGAVREMEARGSTTSLSDLIKRATRLASNLDRGKTASRLGHLDMFGSTEKHSNLSRNSTYSDMLAAFPPPAEVSPARDRPNTMWPSGEKGFGEHNTSSGNVVANERKKERRCCGLAPWLFACLVIFVVLVVVAAVLVPIFLLVIFPQGKSHKSLGTCENTNRCQNGGISTYIQNACSCLCVDGFTGASCTVESGPDCTTAALNNGFTTHNNTTLGNALLPVFNNASSTFGIPLNSSILLSTMNGNNLSCASENSLVTFFGTSNTKRFSEPVNIMDIGLHMAGLNGPASEHGRDRLFALGDNVDKDVPHNVPTATIKQRQVQSTNGIVFATSTQSTPTSVPSAMATQSASGNTSSTSSPSTATATFSATKKQLEFAGVVVLYVLEQHQDIALAVSANQAITAYFRSAQSESNGTVEVVTGSESITADLNKMHLVLANGTILGSGGVSS